MQKLKTKIHIDAPRKKVWDTMLGDKTYREWTSAFSKTSRYVGNWEKGSKILFIGSDPNTGEEGGMVSRTKENRPHEFISIEHLGILVNGKEDTTSPAAKEWTPAFENYTFKDKDGGTELSIEMDIEEKHREMFEEMWPNALKELKRIAER